MDDVQGRDLAELLPHDEEDGVQQVYELGEEVPPAQTEGSDGLLVVRVINGLTVPAVVPCHEEGPALGEHPEAEESLAEIVDNHDPLDVVGLPLLHEPRSDHLTSLSLIISVNDSGEHLDDVDIQNTDDCGGPDRRHQEPVVNSGVP